MATQSDITNPSAVPYPYVDSGDLNMDDLYALVRRARMVALAVVGLAEEANGAEIDKADFEALIVATDDLAWDLAKYARLPEERAYYKALKDREFEFRHAATEADREAVGLGNDAKRKAGAA